MFLDAFVYLNRHYRGREFSVMMTDELGSYTVHEIRGTGRDLAILRTARIDPRSVRPRLDAECARYVARQLDKVFDTRTDAEKLPWQMFAAYV